MGCRDQSAVAGSRRVSLRKTLKRSGQVKYGYIGLGNLGKHLAASLRRAGLTVVVNDLNREAAQSLLDAGCIWADSPRALAEQVDCVITCLPSPAASNAVLTGPDGVLQGLRKGGTWIEMSTTDEREIKRVAAIAAERGISTLECPVTGGVHLAAAGKITVLVGGEQAVFEQHREALQAMGGQIFYMGELGKASVIKV
ncbi:MAG: NAD(P)-dependent oxidoreductase, partial [Gammaproteobacteria bacterium]|nr:NAD(P)-dependent oxidoreductase [Gammaproteobacteria bacterium]